MTKLKLSGIGLLFLLIFSVHIETKAQIQDIKNKSNNNKSNSSSSNSSSSESSGGSDFVGGCLGAIFEGLFEGCISSIFSGNRSDNDNYTYENNENNQLPLVENNYNNQENPLENNTDTIPDVINNQENNDDLINQNKINNNENPEEITYGPQPKTIQKGTSFSLDIRPQFDIGFHKGGDTNYVYVNFLPGLRANLAFFMIDFRYNILTEYTNGNPDSFKSWELLFLANLTANQEFKFIMGAGIHREQYSSTNFTEFYIGTQIPLNQGIDYLEIDTRLSRDFDTDVSPFFEIGGRYNKRFLNFDNLSGYITLGANYQNYYQSHDIWAFRGGIILNIH